MQKAYSCHDVILGIVCNCGRTQYFLLVIAHRSANLSMIMTDIVDIYGHDFARDDCIFAGYLCISYIWIDVILKKIYIPLIKPSMIVILGLLTTDDVSGHQQRRSNGGLANFPFV